MPYKVLIVDDAPFIREILQSYFETKDDFSEVKEATNGEEAVEIFESFSPDIVFMDIVMPKLSGIEATKQIRKKNQTTPIVGLSTLDHGDVIKRMLEAGATSFVKKPFSLEDLDAAIKECL